VTDPTRPPPRPPARDPATPPADGSDRPRGQGPDDAAGPTRAGPLGALLVNGALATLALMLALRFDVEPARGPDPSAPLREALAGSEPPDVVLLGNSTLRFAVDGFLVERLLAEAGHELDVVVHGVDGTFTPYWFLVFKNLVLAAGERPALVGLIFVDPVLTSVRLGMDEEGLERLRHVAAAMEPELWRARLLQTEGTPDRLALELRARFPLYRARTALRGRLLDAALEWPGTLLGPGWPPAGAARRAVLPARVDDPDAAPAPVPRDRLVHEDLYDFEADVDRSLLPSFVALARAAGVELALMRLGRGPRAEVNDPTPPREREAYRRALDAWAGAHRATLLDFARDPILAPGRYLGPDHLDDEGRVLFSARLAQVLARWDALRGETPLGRPARRARLQEALAGWIASDDARPFETVVHEVEIAPGAIEPVRGHLHRAELPRGGDDELRLWLSRGDGPDAPRRSPWTLLEDGRPLGPAHSAHRAIVASGGGRYSHWGDALLFSSSDGTSPVTNGRRYVLRFERPVLR